MTVAGIDRVDHLQTLAVLRVVLAHADRGLEVAERLQVVLDIAAAFVEQIVVDCAFFVNGHQLLQRALADLEALGGNLTTGPRSILKT